MLLQIVTKRPSGWADLPKQCQKAELYLANKATDTLFWVKRLSSSVTRLLVSLSQ